jgi:uncharacterized protein (TIGR00251 family)
VELPPYLSESDGRTFVRVRVQPRAGRERIEGERAGALLVKVKAPPVEGKANEAVCRLLARAAGIPARGAELVRGASARDKVVRLDGVGAEETAARLAERLR